MRVRMLAAAGVGIAMLAGGSVGEASAVPAQAGTAYPDPVAGNFTGDAREELFTYWAGTRRDSLVSFARRGTAVTTSTTPFRVDGTYLPLAGNFDGDPYDEILWYGLGTSPDHLWNFTSATVATSTPMRINGSYRPAVGDFDGDGIDDIFWSGAATYLWQFTADGSHTSTPQAAVGEPGESYQPVVLSFGADDTDDIFWHNDSAPSPDLQWDFVAGTTTHRDIHDLEITRYYTVFSLDAWGDGYGGGDMFLYWQGAGPDPDVLWDFLDGSRIAVRPDPVSGYYGPIVTGDFFADGGDDVFWFHAYGAGAGRSINVWDHEVTGDRTLVRHRYTLPESSWNATSGSTGGVATAQGSFTVGTR